MNEIDMNEVDKEDKADKIRVFFDIVVPITAIDSDFNTLILRLSKLKNFMSRNEIVDRITIEENNRNIQEMENTLENFKIKEIDVSLERN